MKDFKAYLVECKGTYFAGGIWTQSNKALLFSSKKDAIESFPELKYNDEIKFKLIHARLLKVVTK